MKATILLALAVAVAGRLLADEAKAWAVWLHQRIRHLAVAKLPADRRDRYSEEWESGLEEVPGEIFRLLYSVGLLRAAAQMSRDMRKRPAGLGIAFAPMKRAFDILFSGLALISLLPLISIIMICIKLDSPGPVFYTSDRAGKGGLAFRCIKFRTMALDAGKRRAEITFLGRFLRKYSLDGVPQFFNVLRGEMSIVGPRPLLVSYVRNYDLKDLRRLDVSPGVTGLCEARDDDGPLLDRAESLDLAYVENWSLWLDLKILWRAVARTFSQRD